MSCIIAFRDRSVLTKSINLNRRLKMCCQRVLVSSQQEHSPVTIQSRGHHSGQKSREIRSGVKRYGINNVCTAKQLRQIKQRTLSSPAVSGNALLSCTKSFIIPSARHNLRSVSFRLATCDSDIICELIFINNNVD